MSSTIVWIMVIPIKYDSPPVSGQKFMQDP